MKAFRLIQQSGAKSNLLDKRTHNNIDGTRQHECRRIPFILLRRNRRATVSLSPTLTLFLEPHGELYLKLQQVLAQLQVNENTPLLPATRQQPKPPKPKYGIPPVEWPTVQRRVIENQESLRKVAKDYGVSYETVRRVVQAARKQGTG